MKFHSQGWCCIDCLMILANGEANPEWSEDETEEHHKAMDTNIGDLIVTCGGEHEPLCENVEWECKWCHLILTENDEYVECLTDWLYGHDPVYKTWLGYTDCGCESQDFSWHSCDTCDTNLGGSRHAVTFFERN